MYVDRLDPCVRVACAFCAVIAISASSSWMAMTVCCALVLPLVNAHLLHALLHLNLWTLFVWLTLPFTDGGVHSAIVITVKLNLAAIAVLRLVAGLGVVQLNRVLMRARVPASFRVLLLLMARCVFTGLDRIRTMTLAIRLRAPRLRGLPLCRTFGYMLATTLVHNADRGERVAMAMRCRGGMDGFGA
ncbi:MAG: energy-coupling factor transporter transmembrane protein EcfT [Synergistaceae bacterium]|jgi:energy-coupling factor transporter transmembrane protein EcfT|nr:energy-coupling factor transporter transmembrane protein EcfT [Synergistaceae bacterium]